MGFEMKVSLPRDARYVATARLIAAESARRQRDEERMEELLGKIAATGMPSLTDDERHFLEQFSARYRDRS